MGFLLWGSGVLFSLLLYIVTNYLAYGVSGLGFDREIRSLVHEMLQLIAQSIVFP